MATARPDLVAVFEAAAELRIVAEETPLIRASEYDGNSAASDSALAYDQNAKGALPDSASLALAGVRPQIAFAGREPAFGRSSLVQMSSSRPPGRQADPVEGYAAQIALFNEFTSPLVFDTHTAYEHGDEFGFSDTYAYQPDTDPRNSGDELAFQLERQHTHTFSPGRFEHATSVRLLIDNLNQTTKRKTKFTLETGATPEVLGGISWRAFLEEPAAQLPLIFKRLDFTRALLRQPVTLETVPLWSAEIKELTDSRRADTETRMENLYAILEASGDYQYSKALVMNIAPSVARNSNGRVLTDEPAATLRVNAEPIPETIRVPRSVRTKIAVARAYARLEEALLEYDSAAGAYGMLRIDPVDGPYYVTRGVCTYDISRTPVTEKEFYSVVTVQSGALQPQPTIEMPYAERLAALEKQFVRTSDDKEDDELIAQIAQFGSRVTNLEGYEEPKAVQTQARIIDLHDNLRAGTRTFGAARLFQVGKEPKEIDDDLDRYLDDAGNAISSSEYEALVKAANENDVADDSDDESDMSSDDSDEDGEQQMPVTYDRENELGERFTKKGKRTDREKADEGVDIVPDEEDDVVDDSTEEVAEIFDQAAVGAIAHSRDRTEISASLPTLCTDYQLCFGNAVVATKTSYQLYAQITNGMRADDATPEASRWKSVAAEIAQLAIFEKLVPRFESSSFGQQARQWLIRTVTLVRKALDARTIRTAIVQTNDAKKQRDEFYISAQLPAFYTVTFDKTGELLQAGSEDEARSAKNTARRLFKILKSETPQPLAVRNNMLQIELQGYPIVWVLSAQDALENLLEYLNSKNRWPAVRDALGNPDDVPGKFQRGKWIEKYREKVIPIAALLLESDEHNPFHEIPLLLPVGDVEFVNKVLEMTIAMFDQLDTTAPSNDDQTSVTPSADLPLPLEIASYRSAAAQYVFASYPMSVGRVAGVGSVDAQRPVNNNLESYVVRNPETAEISIVVSAQNLRALLDRGVIPASMLALPDASTDSLPFLYFLTPQETIGWLLRYASKYTTPAATAAALAKVGQRPRERLATDFAKLMVAELSGPGSANDRLQRYYQRVKQLVDSTVRSPAFALPDFYTGPLQWADVRKKADEYFFRGGPILRINANGLRTSGRLLLPFGTFSQTPAFDESALQILWSGLAAERAWRQLGYTNALFNVDVNLPVASAATRAYAGDLHALERAARIYKEQAIRRISNLRDDIVTSELAVVKLRASLAKLNAQKPAAASDSGDAQSAETRIREKLSKLQNAEKKTAELKRKFEEQRKAFGLVGRLEASLAYEMIYMHNGRTMWFEDAVIHREPRRFTNYIEAALTQLIGAVKQNQTIVVIDYQAASLPSLVLQADGSIKSFERSDETLPRNAVTVDPRAQKLWPDVRISTSVDSKAIDEQIAANLTIQEFNDAPAGKAPATKRKGAKSDAPSKRGAAADEQEAADVGPVDDKTQVALTKKEKLALATEAEQSPQRIAWPVGSHKAHSARAIAAAQEFYQTYYANLTKAGVSKALIDLSAAERQKLGGWIEKFLETLLQTRDRSNQNFERLSAGLPALPIQLPEELRSLALKEYNDVWREMEIQPETIADQLGGREGPFPTIATLSGYSKFREQLKKLKSDEQSAAIQVLLDRLERAVNRIDATPTEFARLLSARENIAIAAESDAELQNYFENQFKGTTAIAGDADDDKAVYFVTNAKQQPQQPPSALQVAAYQKMGVFFNALLQIDAKIIAAWQIQGESERATSLNILAAEFDKTAVFNELPGNKKLRNRLFQFSTFQSSTDKLQRLAFLFDDQLEVNNVFDNTLRFLVEQRAQVVANPVPTKEMLLQRIQSNPLINVMFAPGTAELLRDDLLKEDWSAKSTNAILTNNIASMQTIATNITAEIVKFLENQRNRVVQELQRAKTANAKPLLTVSLIQAENTDNVFFDFLPKPNQLQSRMNDDTGRDQLGDEQKQNIGRLLSARLFADSWSGDEVKNLVAKYITEKTISDQVLSQIRPLVRFVSNLRPLTPAIMLLRMIERPEFKNYLKIDQTVEIRNALFGNNWSERDVAARLNEYFRTSNVREFTVLVAIADLFFKNATSAPFSALRDVRKRFVALRLKLSSMTIRESTTYDALIDSAQNIRLALETVADVDVAKGIYPLDDTLMRLLLAPAIERARVLMYEEQVPQRIAVYNLAYRGDVAQSLRIDEIVRLWCIEGLLPFARQSTVYDDFVALQSNSTPEAQRNIALAWSPLVPYDLALLQEGAQPNTREPVDVLSGAQHKTPFGADLILSALWVRVMTFYLSLNADKIVDLKDLYTKVVGNEGMRTVVRDIQKRSNALERINYLLHLMFAPYGAPLNTVLGFSGAPASILVGLPPLDELRAIDVRAFAALLFGVDYSERLAADGVSPLSLDPQFIYRRGVAAKEVLIDLYYRAVIKQVLPARDQSRDAAYLFKKSMFANRKQFIDEQIRSVLNAPQRFGTNQGIGDNALIVAALVKKDAELDMNYNGNDYFVVNGKRMRSAYQKRVLQARFAVTNETIQIGPAQDRRDAAVMARRTRFAIAGDFIDRSQSLGDAVQMLSSTKLAGGTVVDGEAFLAAKRTLLVAAARELLSATRAKNVVGALESDPIVYEAPWHYVPRCAMIGGIVRLYQAGNYNGKLPELIETLLVKIDGATHLLHNDTQTPPATVFDIASLGPSAVPEQVSIAQGGSTIVVRDAQPTAIAVPAATPMQLDITDAPPSQPNKRTKVSGARAAPSPVPVRAATAYRAALEQSLSAARNTDRAGWQAHVEERLNAYLLPPAYARRGASVRLVPEIAAPGDESDRLLGYESQRLYGDASYAERFLGGTLLPILQGVEDSGDLARLLARAENWRLKTFGAAPPAAVIDFALTRRRHAEWRAARQANQAPNWAELVYAAIEQHFALGANELLINNLMQRFARQNDVARDYLEQYFVARVNDPQTEALGMADLQSVVPLPTLLLLLVIDERESTLKTDKQLHPLLPLLIAPVRGRPVLRFVSLADTAARNFRTITVPNGFMYPGTAAFTADEILEELTSTPARNVDITHEFVPLRSLDASPYVVVSRVEVTPSEKQTAHQLYLQVHGPVTPNPTSAPPLLRL